MLNININYPYPVIREYTDDYQSTEFIGELKVLLEPDGYAVHTNFEINNKGIQILLSKRILTYALEVQCVSTWFRKLYTIHENRVIRLDPQMIHERVELIPCIVVATSIEGFTNEDFAEEYQDMKFDLNAGDIIGIGQKRTFDALYQNDIIKNGSSIVDVGGNDKLKEIQCDFSQSTIKLTLPADQYENYRSCGYNRSKYKMLNAKINVPPDVIDAARKTNADELDAAVQKNIIPLIKLSQQEAIVRSLKDIIRNDSSIMDNTVIGYCSGYEKQSILGGQVFCISSLLASVIYYACIEVKNSDCAEAIKSITGEYVKEFEDGEPIYFEGSDAKPKPKLTYTLQDPSFDKVFVKVKSWLINLLSGVTEIEIYKVSDVTNRQLRFNRMREYLIDHIGEYVFSRANVSEIIFIQIVELVGRTNKQLFLKNSLKINRMLYYMKIKTKSSRYKMWQQKEYYQLY